MNQYLNDNYSKIEDKTASDLEEELKCVYLAYEYSDSDSGSYCSFMQMVEKFAADNFYHLHYIANEYLKLPSEFRIEFIKRIENGNVPKRY